MHQCAATLWETSFTFLFHVFRSDFCGFHLSLGGNLTGTIWRDVSKTTQISPKNVDFSVSQEICRTKKHHFPSQHLRCRRIPPVPSGAPASRDQWPWQWLQIRKASPAGMRSILKHPDGHPKWIALLSGLRILKLGEGVIVELLIIMIVPCISYINKCMHRDHVQSDTSLVVHHQKV